MANENTPPSWEDEDSESQEKRPVFLIVLILGIAFLAILIGGLLFILRPLATSPSETPANTATEPGEQTGPQEGGGEATATSTQEEPPPEDQQPGASEGTSTFTPTMASTSTPTATSTSTSTPTATFTPDQRSFGTGGLGGFQQPGETRERHEVWFCTQIGEDTFQWYTVDTIYQNGTPVAEVIVDGPFVGPWVPGCPATCQSPMCGDGLCTACGGENSANCLQDCPESCGNGTCANGETNASCPQDCPLTCNPLATSEAQCAAGGGHWTFVAPDILGCDCVCVQYTSPATCEAIPACYWDAYVNKCSPKL